MDQPDRRIRPYTLKAGEGWTYRFGVDFTVKAGEVRDGSGAAFVEYVTRRGEEPPSHIHETEDEMFYVLEGAVTFQHSYTIRSQEPVRLIAVTSPARERPGGGWGGFVADMELGQGELLATPPASPVCQIETSPDKRQSFR
jgi:hypothetical protein